MQIIFERALGITTATNLLYIKFQYGIFFEENKKESQRECLAGSVGRACDSWSQGREFKESTLVFLIKKKKCF